MGGQSSQSQTTTSNTTPWSAAMPAMQGLLGQLEGQIGQAGLSQKASGAIDQLQSNAQAGNPYAGQIGSYATDLLNGGGATGQAVALQGGLDAFKSQMSPYADPNYSSLNNPQLQAALQQVRDDTSQQVNGQFAAAGRDLSGANQMALGRGIASAQAPLLLSQFNQDQALKQNAASSLYNAQNQTGGLLSGLNQQSLANRGQGVSASQDALAAQNYTPTQMLQLEQLRKSLPAEQLGLLAQIGVPIASLGKSTTGTATGTQQMSGMDQFLKGTQGAMNIGKLLFGGMG